MLNIKHCHVLDHVLFSCSSSLSCNWLRLTYSIMSLLTIIFIADWLVVADMIESLHHLTLESSKLWGGQVSDKEWLGLWRLIRKCQGLTKVIIPGSFLSTLTDHLPLQTCGLASFLHAHTHIIHTHLHKSIHAFFKVLTYSKCLCILLSYLRAFPCHQRSLICHLWII